MSALALAAFLLLRPPPAEAVTAKSYSAYLNDARPVTHQWWGGLESWQGHHFLNEPVASNTENASEENELLRQWWFGLEAKRGSHFLNEPVGSNMDSTSELHSLLNQWQNALEAWRGSHFLNEPPSPFTNFLPQKTGTFGLTPKRAAVRPDRSFTYRVKWTVPRPNNWHDLRTIDLRACRSSSVLRLRWTELTNTLSLLNRRGRVVATGRIGAARQLRSRTAIVSLAGSSTKASGPTSRSMTLGLALRFRGAAKGRDCAVELAARDDLGNRDGFKPAGRLRVRQ